MLTPSPSSPSVNHAVEVVQDSEGGHAVVGSPTVEIDDDVIVDNQLIHH